MMSSAEEEAKDTQITRETAEQRGLQLGHLAKPWNWQSRKHNNDNIAEADSCMVKDLIKLALEG